MFQVRFTLLLRFKFLRPKREHLQLEIENVEFENVPCWLSSQSFKTFCIYFLWYDKISKGRLNEIQQIGKLRPCM